MYCECYDGSNMDKELQEKLSLLKVSVLSFLNTLAVTDSVALDLNEISTSTSTPEVDLRGIIGTLRRMKIGNESLIKVAGRDKKGRLKWKINESIVSKNDLAKFLEEEILGKEGLKIKR